VSQIARRNPSQLVLLGHGENSIFEILLEHEVGRIHHKEPFVEAD
jgi:FlaA1/EpsC-like NDP-sugar epimerase